MGALRRTVRLIADSVSGGKFWQAQDYGDKLIIGWGVIGTTGQRAEVGIGKCERRDSGLELQKRMDKKLKDLKEGYRVESDQLHAAADPAPPPPKPNSTPKPDKLQVYFEPACDPAELLVQATVIAAALGINAAYTDTGVRIECAPEPLQIRSKPDPTNRVIAAKFNTQADTFVLSLAALCKGFFSSDLQKQGDDPSRIVRDRLQNKAANKELSPELVALLEEAGVLSESWVPRQTAAPSGALQFDI